MFTLLVVGAEVVKIVAGMVVAVAAAAAAGWCGAVHCM